MRAKSIGALLAVAALNLTASSASFGRSSPEPGLPQPHLVVYRVGDSPFELITLTVQPSARALIFDRGTSKTFRFRLSSKALARLKRDIAKAGLLHLKSSYKYTGSPILCGTPAQSLTAEGRTIHISYGPPKEPAGLHRVLQQLLNEVVLKDRPKHAADPGARVATICTAQGGSRGGPRAAGDRGLG